MKNTWKYMKKAWNYIVYLLALIFLLYVAHPLLYYFIDAINWLFDGFSLIILGVIAFAMNIQTRKEMKQMKEKIVQLEKNIFI